MRFKPDGNRFAIKCFQILKILAKAEDVLTTDRLR